MSVFPTDHVCPLAVEQNKLRCSDASGKPNAACASCRAELMDELENAMLEGNTSFFEMLFVGHVLEREGFVGVPDEEGGIQLERTRGRFKECPGDCVVGITSPVLGGGCRLFIAMDDNHEVSEDFETLEDAMSSYFNHKGLIDRLVKSV